MQRAIDLIHRIIFCICMAGMTVLILMMFLTVADVVGRSFLNRPIPGTFEISKFLLVVIVLFGIAYVEQTGQNIRVDFFTNKMSPLVRLILDIIFTLAAIIFFSLITYQGWKEGFVIMEVGTSSDIWRIPAFPFQFLIPVGCFLLVVELILRLIASISAARRVPEARIK